MRGDIISDYDLMSRFMKASRDLRATIGSIQPEGFGNLAVVPGDYLWSMPDCHHVSDVDKVPQPSLSGSREVLIRVGKLSILQVEHMVDLRVPDEMLGELDTDGYSGPILGAEVGL